MTFLGVVTQTPWRRGARPCASGRAPPAPGLAARPGTAAQPPVSAALPPPILSTLPGMAPDGGASLGAASDSRGGAFLPNAPPRILIRRFESRHNWRKLESSMRCSSRSFGSRGAISPAWCSGSWLDFACSLIKVHTPSRVVISRASKLRSLSRTAWRCRELKRGGRVASSSAVPLMVPGSS